MVLAAFSRDTWSVKSETKEAYKAYTSSIHQHILVNIDIVMSEHSCEIFGNDSKKLFLFFSWLVMASLGEKKNWSISAKLN